MLKEAAVNEHPSDETIAAFTDGRLEGRPRESVIEHIAMCDECRAVWDSAAEFQVADESVPQTNSGAVKPFRFRQSLPIAASMIIALLALPAVRWFADRDIRALHASADALPNRLIKARLSGYKYREFDPHRGGAPRPRTVQADAENVLASREKTLTSKDARASGQAHLVLREWDEAVQSLERASALAPRDVEVLSDLSAAYIERAAHKRNPADYIRAAEVAERAYELSPRSPAVLFNRALALDGAHNAAAAKRAWEEYLRVDDKSGWAAEARERLKNYREPQASASDWPSFRRAALAAAQAGSERDLETIARQYLLRCRGLVENDLLPGWADAWLRRDRATAAPNLQAASAISGAVARVSGDPSLRDAVAGIEAAVAAQDSSRATAFARAHATLREAYERAKQYEATKAADLYARAAAEFASLTSPFAVIAEKSEAQQRFFSRDYAGAERLLTRARPAAVSYATVFGDLAWIGGMVALANGRDADALKQYELASNTFKQISDTESEAGIESAIAENFSILGDTEKAWEHRVRSVDLATQAGDTQRLQIVYNEAAEAALELRCPRVALLFQNEVVAAATADPHGSPYLSAYAYLWRAVVQGAVGRMDAASADLRDAGQFAASVSDPQMRRNTSADVGLATGLVLQTHDRAAAIAALTHTIDTQRAVGYAFRLPQLYLARGRAYLAGGELEPATTDFKTGLEQLESQRSQVDDAEQRVSVFGRADDLFDEAISVSVRRRDVAAAFAFAERSKARTLLDTYRDQQQQPAAVLDVGQVLGALPENNVLVEYAVTAGATYVWVIGHNGQYCTRLSATRAELSAAIDRLYATLSTDDPAFRAAAGDLYDAVVRPLHLPREHLLLFVPDGPLARLPFAALYDRETDEFLCQTNPVATEPSASVYAAAAARAERLQTQPVRYDVAAIGNAEPKQDFLERLPRVESGLRAVTESVPRSRLLIGSEATPRHLIDVAREAAVLYVAGHALPDDERPARSCLVLSPDPGEHADGLLRLSDLGGRAFSTRVVFLAACGTAAPDASGRRETTHLANAFLGAGAAAVIGSLWPVGDRAASEFMQRFHRRLLAKRNAVSALRDTQVEFLTQREVGNSPPAQWAAFTISGAATK